MNPDIPLSLYEKVIGMKVLKYVESLRAEELLSLVDSEAMQILSKILEALDDESTDDPECFQRISAIIDAYSDSGIQSFRHDW